MLTSLHSAVVVVDRDLSVRAWNDAATELWGLRQEEVHGHHFLNLDIGLPAERLGKPIRACLESGERQAITLEATNRRGKPITCSITCNPLRGHGGELGGVILVMDAMEA